MKAKHFIGGLSFLGLCACLEQPQGHCQVAQAQGEAHFVVYEAIVPMEGACEKENLKSERVGFETYQLPGKDKISIAWRTETLQTRFDMAREAEVWDSTEEQEQSLGLNVQAEYSSRPDTENRCHIFDEKNPADSQRIRWPSKTFEAFEIPAKEPEDEFSKPEGPKRFPKVTYQYEWRNLIVYSLPASPGQLIEGEVTYGVKEEEGALCEGQYRFVALWPAYACKTDDDCTPSVRGKAGSPLNPDFAGFLKCHFEEGESEGHCMVTRPPAELIQKLAK